MSNTPPASVAVLKQKITQLEGLKNDAHRMIFTGSNLIAALPAPRGHAPMSSRAFSKLSSA